MKKRVAIDHFQNFRAPSRLKIGPDGRISFLLRQASVADNKYYSDVYTLAGEKLVRLTSSRDVGNYWWVDGELVFAAARLEKDKDYKKSGRPLTVFQKLSADGGEAQELFRVKMNVSDVQWISQNECYFVASYSALWNRFLSENDGDEDKALKALKEENDYMVCDEIPFWENGVGPVNKVRNRLYYYNNGEVTAITDELTNVSGVQLLKKDRVVFFASRYEDKKSRYGNVMMYDAGQLKDISLPQDITYYHFGVVDAEHIVLDANDTLRHGHRQNGDHILYNVLTGEKEVLYSDMAYSGNNTVGSDVKLGNPYSPQWVGDGKGHMYFVSTQDDCSHIFCEDLAAKTITQVTKANGNLLEFCLVEDGFVVAAMRGNAGMEIYHVAFDGTEKCLSAINAALGEEYEVSTPETFTFTDPLGNEVRGWVIKPIGFEEGKKYPTILEIHGGPKTAFGSVYFHEMQYLAAQGYGVIFCNPWGSDGKGAEFADIRGKYGTIDFDQIMQFVDLCLERNAWIDADKLGVAGGSYGGFMTNWIIGHTSRFKAAASQRSIANWVTMMNSSDIGMTFGLDQCGADAWTDINALWGFSPMKYADKCTTPTLFIHADQDYRCWLVEGIQMFSALKYLGKEARLCVFKGENHELSRSGQPKHRVRRLQEIVSWFDQHLK